MRFWDASAVVPLLVRQSCTDLVRRWRADDPVMVTWWATEIECVSAIARLERETRLDRRGTADALRRLDAIGASWHEVQPSDGLKQTARRLLRSHALRAGDAFQLAAALHAAELRPASLDFVCLDDRLSLAAEREGFGVVCASEPAPAAALPAAPRKRGKRRGS